MAITFAAAFWLFSSQALAVSCEEPSASGDYYVAADCSFYGTTDGVDGGDIYINTGVTLTINSAQTVSWATGYSIIVNGTIINFGGIVTQTAGGLWAVDADGDHYTPALTWYTDANKPANSVRVNTLTDRTVVDCDDADLNYNVSCYSYAYSQGYYYGYGQGYYYGYGQGYYYTYGQGYYYTYGQGYYYGYGQGYYYGYGQGSYGGYTAGCFTEQTKIAMADGSFKEIKSVKPGDAVFSFNVKTGEKTAETVKELLVHPNIPGGYLVINKTLEVTPNHLVWSPNKNDWVGIGSLKVGDSLLNADGQAVTINSIDKVEGTNTVYNLSLLGPNNNFFTENFLVHNHKVF